MKEKQAEVGITVKKSEDFSEWYQQVVLKSELADYSKVSGCMVYRPKSYEIWEKIQDFFNKKIKSLGVKNAYFPLLIPESLLNKEAEHVEGFAPEVAWVTHGGSSKLNEKLAVRPTSETIMYDSYSKWIKSHRDLPLRLNQWNNIVRWEFKDPMPFVRGREILWQEGHTAFATRKEAKEEVLQILDYYESVYHDLLAVPVLKGRKSEKEKFAGADFTTSVEVFLPMGKAAQAATSHLLGQNFAKAFDISFKDENEEKQYVWQNSWGLSMRAIGMMIIVHGDDKGLVIPPKATINKIVIVPIIFKKSKDEVFKKAKELKKELKKFNPIFDDREGYSAGWKFNEWELKGIPIRLELGPRDIENNQVVLVRRDTGKKKNVKLADLKQKINQMLEDIQNNLFENAKKFLDESIIEVKDFKQFKSVIKKEKIAFGQWCGEVECEDWIKDKSGGAKSLNIPFGQEKIKGKCVHCSKPAKFKAYFSKSY
ncbi:MAG: Proline--tRNA ligase [Candidatus Woesearchaeota archaeon]|nr:Proline--tRNA ligase [Candidatus Woesearchaeota archaeon]